MRPLGHSLYIWVPLQMVHNMFPTEFFLGSVVPTQLAGGISSSFDLLEKCFSLQKRLETLLLSFSQLHTKLNHFVRIIMLQCMKSILQSIQVVWREKLGFVLGLKFNPRIGECKHLLKEGRAHMDCPACGWSILDTKGWHSPVSTFMQATLYQCLTQWQWKN